MPQISHYSDVLRHLTEVRRTTAETLTELCRADLSTPELRFALGHAAMVLETAGRTIRAFLTELE